MTKPTVENIFALCKKRFDIAFNKEGNIFRQEAMVSITKEMIANRLTGIPSRRKIIQCPVSGNIKLRMSSVKAINHNVFQTFILGARGFGFA